MRSTVSKALANYQVYLSLLNEADVVASLDARNLYLRQFIGFRLQAHILFELVF
jgi:hypothetical protein